MHGRWRGQLVSLWPLVCFSVLAPAGVSGGGGTVLAGEVQDGKVDARSETLRLKRLASSEKKLLGGHQLGKFLLSPAERFPAGERDRWHETIHKQTGKSGGKTGVTADVRGTPLPAAGAAGQADGGGAGGNPCVDCLVGEIACGGSVEGTLANTDCALGDGSFFDVYRLELAAVQNVTINLTSPVFDTYLFFVDGDCNLVSQNDDCGGSLNSCLTATVPAGTYHVVANSFSGGATGAYTVQVACADNTTCADCLVGAIACNEPVTGNLPAAPAPGCTLPSSAGQSMDIWAFELATDAPVTITQTAAFDTIVVLLDSNCVVIAGNDDCPTGGLNSCMTVDLSAGSYFVGASSYDVGASGEYNLAVTCHDVSLCTGCEVGALACGDSTVSGNLPVKGCVLENGSPGAMYTLDVVEPSLFSLRLRSAGFDPVLTLRNNVCAVIATNDDCEAETTDACLSFAPLLPGSYSVEVGSTGPEASGAYELEVSCGPFNPCLDCQVGSIACGGSASGTLTQGDCLLGDGTFFDLYTFELPKAQTVTFNLHSSAFDTYLILVDSACGGIASNDDCTEVGDSCLAIDLPAGSYYVVANSFSVATGSYSLDVSCSDIRFCQDCTVGKIGCQDTIGGFLDASDCALPADGSRIDLYELTLPQSTQVDIQLTSPAYDTYLILWDSACTAIAFNDDCVGLNSCLMLGLDAGTYFVGANSFQPGQLGPYSLQVTATECRRCPACQVGTIACDETVTGTLPTSNCSLPGGGEADFWQLQVAEEEEATITLTSNEFDPLLALLDADCNEIARNDDCDANTLNSCLYPTLAPGTYYLAASTFFAGQGGGYSLRVSCGGAQRLPGDIIQGDGLNLTDGVEVLGYLFLGSPSRLPCGNGSPRDPANLTLLDWNDDAIINLTDVVSLFMYLYLGGRPHFLGGGCIAIPGCPTGVCE